MARKTRSAAALQHEAIGQAARTRPFRRTEHPDAQWFGGAGLGLFVHWGISTVDRGIDLSWGMMADKPWGGGTITPERYFGLAERFNPGRYDPDRWLAAARAAGFAYAVLTARHHDGFALWPSAHGLFGVRQHLKGRDLVRPFIEACRRQGLKVGLYYSPPDWYWHRHHMSFRYGSTGETGCEHYGLRHEPMAAVLPAPPGLDQEYRAYLRGQTLELLTGYGRIDVLFFDGGPAVLSVEEIRRLQPGIVINPRAHGQGDYATPECELPRERPAGWWELCEIWAPSCGWGYSDRYSGSSHREYRTVGWFLSRLARVRAWGGNYLINCGPLASGEMPPTYYRRMRELSTWMRHSGEAVFGTRGGPYPEQCTVPTTVREDTWYLHVLPNEEGPIRIRGVTAPPRAVSLLRTGEPVRFSLRRGTLTLEPTIYVWTGLDDVFVVRW